MRASKEKIHNQGCFVDALGTRLIDDVEKWNRKTFPDNHCQIQDDIKRLRRELMKLSKMFEWDYEKEQKNG